MQTYTNPLILTISWVFFAYLSMFVFLCTNRIYILFVFSYVMQVNRCYMLFCCGGTLTAWQPGGYTPKPAFCYLFPASPPHPHPKSISCKTAIPITQNTINKKDDIHITTPLPLKPLPINTFKPQ